MSVASERLRELLSTPGCTNIAPVFDPISARIAEMVGWQVAKLAGSVGKAVAVGVPESTPLANITDIASLARQITRVSDLSLVIDADDGGESALTMRRTIRELEAAGVAAVEIEDEPVAHELLTDRHALESRKDQCVARIKAAVAAKSDSSTVIFARTTVLRKYPLDLALDWVAGYAKAGADVIMLSGGGPSGLSSNPREDVQAVQETVQRPLCVSGLSRELIDDEEWIVANRVQLRNNGQSPYRMAIKAIHEAMIALQTGFAEDMSDRWASDELLAGIAHKAECDDWTATYGTY